LKGGIEAWTADGNELDRIENITPEDFVAKYPVEEMNVLDVRKRSEYDSQHVDGVTNFPLDFIYQNAGELDKSKNYTVHCAGGYRSVAAASILKKLGVAEVANVLGGFNAMKQVDGLPVSDYTEQTTML
jgi:rhodanese-related sulfurtransferase